MQIHQLPEQQTIDDADMFAIDTGQTTRRTPFSAIKAIVSAFAHQLTNLTETTAVSDEDVLPIDDGNGAKKITYGNLKNKITQDATPAFDSVDASSSTSWTSVAVLASGEALTSVYNKISAMFKNIRYLYYKIGTNNVSGTGKSSLTAIIGNTSISSLGNGTLSGAVNTLNTEITNTRTGTYTGESQAITFPSAYVSSGTITIRKKGSLAMIHGATVVVSASIPSGTLLCALPSGYYPYHETYIGTSSFNSMMRIVSSGNVYAATAISPGTYFFDGNWMHQ